MIKLNPYLSLPGTAEKAIDHYKKVFKTDQVVMPLAIQFWGDYFGMCKDQFGVCWMVNYHEEE